MGVTDMSKIIHIFQKQKPKQMVVIPDEVSLGWLWQILPVEYWLLLITLLILSFVMGIVVCYFFVL